MVLGFDQVFDVMRKNTYQNLATWYSELRQYCETIPVILVANKIDVDYKVWCAPESKQPALPPTHTPFVYFVGR